MDPTRAQGILPPGRTSYTLPSGGRPAVNPLPSAAAVYLPMDETFEVSQCLIPTPRRTGLSAENRGLGSTHTELKKPHG
jgi:hypothetical protein